MVVVGVAAVVGIVAVSHVVGRDAAVVAVGAETGRTGSAAVSTLARRPEQLWQVGDERAAGIAYGDDSVYHVSSRDTRLFVYDADRGELETRANLGQPVLAFASGGRHLHALLRDSTTVVTIDAESRRETWRRTWAGAGRLRLSAGDGHVFVASKGALRALDPADGSLRWRWDSSGDAVIGPPEAAGGIVYVPHVDAVTALDAVNGQARWRLDIVTQHISAGPSIATFVTTDGLVGVDASTGERLWRVAGPVHGSGEVASGSVFAFVGDALLRIDPDSGDVRWRQVLVAPEPTVRVAGPYASDTVVYLTMGSRLLAFATADGEPQWALEDPGGSTIRLLLVVDDRLLFASGQTIRAYGAPIP